MIAAQTRTQRKSLTVDVYPVSSSFQKSTPKLLEQNSVTEQVITHWFAQTTNIDKLFII